MFALAIGNVCAWLTEGVVLDSTFDVLDAPAPGTYENCELVAWLSRKSDHEYSEQLVVPVGTVVVAA